MKPSKLLLILGVFFTIGAVLWLNGRHAYFFNSGDDMTVSMTTSECEICFWSNEVDYTIEFTDSESEESQEFAFVAPNGPCVKIVRDLEVEGLFLIEGYEGNEGSNWEIDLLNQSIRSMKSSETVENATMELVQLVTSDHKLRKR